MTDNTTANAKQIVAALADDLRYIATILEANASKFAVPNHIPQKARKCREAADLLTRTAAQPEREAVLEEAELNRLAGRLCEIMHCEAGQITRMWAKQAVLEIAALTTPAPAESVWGFRAKKNGNPANDAVMEDLARRIDDE